jgi:glycosyltransferase involved in cell wall biosynthesis
MKIGINGYEAIIPRFGFDPDTGLPIRVGSAEVCFELLKELEKLDKKNEYKIFLPGNPTSDLPKERKNWSYEMVPSKRLWTLFSLRKAVNRVQLDLFFNPTHYSPLFLNCPQVIAVLDISYKYFPGLFEKKDLYKLKLWGGMSLRSAKGIITISNSSKDDIIKEYRIPAERISVVHLGIRDISASKMTKEELFKKYSVDSPYLLFVGTIQPRKNIKRLIEAFTLLANDSLELVIVGKKGWNYEDILAFPKKLGVEGRVIFLHSVADSELPLFYKNAEVFVLPSLYEGFGLPVLEAMKYGCPVITSNVSSLPEAGGDAAEYIDPESSGDIASKIEKVLNDKKLRDRMIEKGREQVKKFSWEKAANEVVDVFDRFAK